MSPQRPHTAALFKFTFAHLPEPPVKPDTASTPPQGGQGGEQPTKPPLKIFGFFDILQVEKVLPPVPGQVEPLHVVHDDPEQVSADRLQRSLLAFGPAERVEQLVARCRDEKDPVYMAVCLLKLAGPDAHGKFDEASGKIIALDKPNTAHLVCLDAPDVIVLATFGGKEDPEPHPLERLISWMEKLSRGEHFDHQVERSLTMVACRDPLAFDTQLAQADGTSSARALVRVTDMRNGVGLRELAEQIQKDGRFPAMFKNLYTSVGYYDAQAVLSIPEAACLLRLAAPLVKNRRLMTSTCFLGRHNPGKPEERSAEAALMLDSVLAAWRALDLVLQWRQENHCLKRSTRKVVAEAVTRFQRLHSTGFIPGSRLLLWTCRDALLAFTEECKDNRLAREEKPEKATSIDSEFYMRQSVYGDFFRAVSDELDRRVSLSLAAHTRFFPCSIEVPVKLIGALDMLGRLMAASFRCYRCRQHTGVLQVFSAKSDKPSEYRYVSGMETFRATKHPVPTVMVTTFSPRMVRHFYLAMFTVMHEVAQCVFVETVTWPSFSAVVMSHAFVERLAVLGTLASLRADAPVQREVPKFVHQWTAEFLAREVLDVRWWVEKTRIGPEYFADPPMTAIPEDLRPKNPSKVGGYVWQTQVSRWRVSHVDPATKKGAEECYQLFRDARSFPDLSQAVKASGLMELWQQNLLVHLGSLPEEMASGAKDLQDKPMTYAGKMGDIASSLKRWSEACAWGEYIELASFIPILRLFEADKDNADFLTAIRALACDCAEVWRDSESRSVAYDFARRFLVAVAAMDVYHAHQRGEGINDPSLGPAADAVLAAALQRSATSLESCLPDMREGHTRTACTEVWSYVSRPETAEPLTAVFAYGREVAHPMIIHAMVRYLVRLIHVYSLKGPNILPEQVPDLEELNARVRKILFAREQAGSERIPVKHVNELWALQYRLSELRPDINYLFSLADVMTAAGWKKPSPK